MGWQPQHPSSSQFTHHDPPQLTRVLVPSSAPCLERHWGLELLDTSDKMRGSLGRYIGNTGSSILQFPSHHKGFLSHGQHTILQAKGKPLEHRIPMCRVMYEVVYIRFLLEKMHAAFSAKRVCQGLKIGHWKDSVPYMQLLASANHAPLVKPPSVLRGILTSIPPLFLAGGVKCTKVKCS